MTKKDFEVNVNLDFSIDDINDIYDYKYYSNEARDKDLGRLAYLSQKRHTDIEINEIYDIICKELNSKLKEGVTEKEAKEISENIVSKYLRPFLIHHIHKIRRSLLTRAFSYFM